MSYLKSFRMLILLLVAVALILVPGFMNEAVAGKKVMISLSDLNDIITGVHEGDDSDSDSDSDSDHHVDMDDDDDDRYVVIAVQPNADYEAGHPAGAYQWEQKVIRDNRTDGLLLTKRQVAFDTTMNDILAKAGIDDDSIIVITGNNMQQIGLAYFSFRYWGFHKKNLRVMNGLIKDYISAGYATETGVSPDAGGSYTVCDEKQNKSVDRVRASLAETMSVATDSDPNTYVLDVRSLAEFDGTKGRNDVAFEGAIKTATWNEWVTEVTTGSAAAPGTQIKSKEDLKAIYAAIGLTSDHTAYIY